MVSRPLTSGWGHDEGNGFTSVPVVKKIDIIFLHIFLHVSI